LLKARQEFECRTAQAGSDFTRIVFATHSDDDEMWIMLRHRRSDDVAGSSESGITLSMYAEIRLEIGQHCAQRVVRASSDILMANRRGDPPAGKQMPLRPRADETEVGTPLACQLSRPHHRAVRRGRQIGRNEDSLQDRHDAHLPASDTLPNRSAL
jgi:hypothetical protein